MFEYKTALKSKMWKSVDSRILTLELMKEYPGLSYEYFTEIIPDDIRDMMIIKMNIEIEKKNSLIPKK